MNEVKAGILLVFLFFCAVWDLKNKAIPVWLCLTGTAVVISTEFLSGKMNMAEIIGGVLIESFLLAVCKVTKGQIGPGDGIVFIITGISLGTQGNLLLLTGSLMLMFLYSAFFVCLKKINLKTRLPFLPFVFGAYILEMAMGLGSV